MSRTLIHLGLTLGLVACGGGDPASDDDDDGGAETGASSGEDTGEGGSGDGTGGTGGGTGGETVVGTAGCGTPSPHPTGGVQLSIDAGAEGDGERGFFLVVPSDYDPDVPHDLVLGYPGTNWVGQQIRSYLDLEGRTSQPTVFVYPDPLWRDFPGWGNYGGWVLGPHGANAQGNGDLVFTEAILDQLSDELCLDPDQFFATGHSWGGDMAQVVACFLGDRIAAAAPAAANTPYWFRTGGGWASCEGQPGLWTFHGIADDYFNDGGLYGLEVTDAWLSHRSCDADWTPLDLDGASDCRDYGCDAELRLCLYGPATGHQIPSYFSQTVMDWFGTY